MIVEPECLGTKLRICTVVTLMTGVNDTLEIKQMIFSEVQIYNKILNYGALYIFLNLCDSHPPLTVAILLLVSSQPVHPRGKAGQVIHLVLQPSISENMQGFYKQQRCTHKNAGLTKPNIAY